MMKKMMVMCMLAVGSVMAGTLEVYDCKMLINEPVLKNCGECTSYKNETYKGYMCLDINEDGTLAEENCQFFVYCKKDGCYQTKVFSTVYTVLTDEGSCKDDVSCNLNCSDDANDYTICGVAQAGKDCFFKAMNCNLVGTCSDIPNVNVGKCNFRLNKKLSKEANACGFESAIKGKLPAGVKFAE